MVVLYPALQLGRNEGLKWVRQAAARSRDDKDFPNCGRRYGGNKEVAVKCTRVGGVRCGAIRCHTYMSEKMGSRPLQKLRFCWIQGQTTCTWSDGCLILTSMMIGDREREIMQIRTLARLDKIKAILLPSSSYCAVSVLRHTLLLLQD